jgi:hypothetical protein
VQITHVKRREGHSAVEITALIGSEEFRQLKGELSHLLIFPVQLVSERATYTKTGNRHNFAKYLLLPKHVRRQVPCAEFDFGQMHCAAVQGDGCKFVIYCVPGKANGIKRQDLEPLPEPAATPEPE